MAHFDRFDICEAHYMFAMNWHDGQFGKLYRKFGQLERMQFKMRPLRTSNPLRELEVNAQEIYYHLVQKYHPKLVVSEMISDMLEKYGCE